MKRIAVVGSGEIGSRHLQGLAKSKNKLSLYVVDSNNDSLELSKKRYNEAGSHKSPQCKIWY